jgi:hypothetical protein
VEQRNGKKLNEKAKSLLLQKNSMTKYIKRDVISERPAEVNDVHFSERNREEPLETTIEAVSDTINEQPPKITEEQPFEETEKHSTEKTEEQPPVEENTHENEVSSDFPNDLALWPCHISEKMIDFFNK